MAWRIEIEKAKSLAILYGFLGFKFGRDGKYAFLQFVLNNSQQVAPNVGKLWKQFV